MSGLEIRPQVTVTAEIRRASSDCCGARLNPDREPRTFTCRACGQPCGRVMGPGEEVILHG